MAKQYLRCYRDGCQKLLTTRQLKEHGHCKCGSKKVYAVDANTEFTFWEKWLIKKGLAHEIDTSIPGPDPDDLNLENDKYWERVTSEIGEEKANLRRALARNRVEQCQNKK